MKNICGQLRTRASSLLLPSVTVALILAPQASPAAAPVVTQLGARRQISQAPARLAVDEAGSLYVTDTAAGQVVVFDAFGRPASVKMGFADPLGIALDRNGRIYLGEKNAGSVTVFDSRWNLLYKLGSGNGEFALPNFIATDPTPGSGAVYVSDSVSHQVKVYTNATFAFAFGSQGTNVGQFDFPTGVWVSPSNEVYVVDQNNNRVQVFDPGGGFLRAFTLVTRLGGMGLGSAGGRSQGIAGDSAGRVYVTDTFQDFIRVFDAQGVYLSRIGVFGQALGQLRSPAGLAVDRYDRLQVGSVNNNRIDLFGLDAFVHFTAAPAAQAVAAGTNVAFSILFGGTGPFSCQWRKGTNNLSDGGTVSGATTPTLRLTGVTLADAGTYSVVVNGPSGPLTSPEAVLSVRLPPTIVTPPASQTVTQGANVPFNVVATGDSLTYQWQHNGTVIPGSTVSTLQLENVQPYDRGNYAVVVNNEVGTVTSPTAVLTVVTPPVILSQPVSQNVVLGDTASFTVAAAGESINYQWQRNGTNLLAATAATLQLPNAQFSDAGPYSVVVSNLAGSLISDPATLTVLIPPASPQISTVNLLTNGAVQLIVAGDPGFNFAIEASADLITWMPLTELVSVAGTIEFIDLDAIYCAQRFYRVRWVP